MTISHASDGLRAVGCPPLDSRPAVGGGERCGSPPIISLREGDGPEPERIGLAIAALVFAVFAVSAVINGWYHRVRFWLRTSVDCCVCHRRMRQAWFPGKTRISQSVKIASVSSTICPECFKQYDRFRASNTPI